MRSGGTGYARRAIDNPSAKDLRRRTACILCNVLLLQTSELVECRSSQSHCAQGRSSHEHGIETQLKETDDHSFRLVEAAACSPRLQPGEGYQNTREAVKRRQRSICVVNVMPCCRRFTADGTSCHWPPRLKLLKLRVFRPEGPTQGRMCRPFRPESQWFLSSGGSRHRQRMCQASSPNRNSQLQKLKRGANCSRSFAAERRRVRQPYSSTIPAFGEFKRSGLLGRIVFSGVL